MTLEDALRVAKTGGPGAVQIDEPWVSWHHEQWTLRPQKTIHAPGLVDIPYLRSLIDVRAWKPEDAH